MKLVPHLEKEEERGGGVECAYLTSPTYVSLVTRTLAPAMVASRVWEKGREDREGTRGASKSLGESREHREDREDRESEEGSKFLDVWSNRDNMFQTLKGRFLP